MKRIVVTVVSIVCCALNMVHAEDPYYRDIYPDTWVATDALGRTMPELSAVGPVKKDQRRVVGIFYITWHSDSLGKLKSPYTADVTKVLAGDPSRPPGRQASALDGRHRITGASRRWAIS